MHLTVRGERAGEHLLGAGLADATGDRNDPRIAARPRGAAEIGKRREHVLDHDQRAADPTEARQSFRRDHGAAGAGAKRLADIVMAIKPIPLDREEGLAGRHRAAVDGDPGDGFRLDAEGATARCLDESGECPQRRGHAASSAASTRRTA